jgi:hypothetical protein
MKERDALEVSKVMLSIGELFGSMLRLITVRLRNRTRGFDVGSLHHIGDVVMSLNVSEIMSSKLTKTVFLPRYSYAFSSSINGVNCRSRTARWGLNCSMD